MPSYKVKVKWGKELYKDVEVNADEPPILFKAQLYALTGVQPDRQKVMLKGVTVKDEEWGSIKFADGFTFLLMGSKEDVPKEPEVKPVFVEDMSDKELAVSMDLPGGLTNLGNTCYMNATIQCLKSVPELRIALNRFEGAISFEGDQYQRSITAALRDLYNSLDKGGSLPPFILLQLLHSAFPRFAEKRSGGQFMQHDANEFWVELVRILQQKLPPYNPSDNSRTTQESNFTGRSFVDQYFGGTYDVELECTESDQEPKTNSVDHFLQLSCFISQDVKYLNSGLKSKVTETINKHSTILDRDAVFKKTAKINRLPAYLTIQFVRFQYKEKEKINAKVLKDINFPLELDVYDLCTEKLQERLEPMRKMFKKVEEAEVTESLSQNKVKSKVAVESTKTYKTEPYSFPDDVGSNNSGYYNLQAVLTHKGRTSTSGHYVAWIRYKDNWMKCDDENVSPVTSEDIVKLSGGGDWHCAYVLLYGPKLLKMATDDEPST